MACLVRDGSRGPVRAKGETRRSVSWFRDHLEGVVLFQSNLQRIVVSLACIFWVLAPASSLLGVEENETNIRSGDGEVPRDFGRRSGLALPSTMSTIEYERLLFPFLQNGEYQKLGWLKDKGVRDTGPYIQKKSYGTHPAVRIFYSPEIIDWLLTDRQGDIPDGAMMVKEHYQEPAARHFEKDEQQLLESLLNWTVMVKDSSGSFDGWFWSNPDRFGVPKDNHPYPFPHAVSGFGHYCIRCHASTKSPGPKNEYTFASLRNVEGFSGSPLLFRVDESWRSVKEKRVERPKPKGEASSESTEPETAIIEGSHPNCTNQSSPVPCVPRLNSRFVQTYGSLSPTDRSKIQAFPPVTHDWALMDRDATQGFVTSNQCMSCHAGLVGPLGPAMFVASHNVKGMPQADYPGKGWHVSPYGEWRWTPMGLAGRDPVFHAQMELELALIEKRYGSDPDKAKLFSAELQQTCLSCHAAMGKHQFDLDHVGSDETFNVNHVYSTYGEGAALGLGDGKYGALARDGVSCTVCHRAQPREQPEGDDRSYLEFYLATSITGNILFGKPGEIYGPFEDKEISPYAMEHALGFKPKHSDYIKSSRMCGSCHTVNLPILNRPFLPGETPGELVEAEANPSFKPFHHHVEQATYLEWLNSEFENEFNENNPKAKSCQDCHMSRKLRDPEAGVDKSIVTRIAAIQDTTYPDAENLASHEELLVRVRKEGYSRHNFSGLNVFLLEMFDQFDDVLGVRKHDFMTGSKNDMSNSESNFLAMAHEEVADLRVTAAVRSGVLLADVVVKNKVGHRFPSGVGFRRAFIEFTVTMDGNGSSDPRILWSSGRTDELGILVDSKGRRLPTEFFDEVDGKQSYQKHHEVITSPQQVQIYETLLEDHHQHRITTSFVHGCDTIKDNRLLPRGWREEGPSPALKGFFLKSTMPGPVAATDARYQDGSGSDRTRYRVKLPAGIDPTTLKVKATLYYQSMPPYFLKALFEGAPDGKATQRLHHILSNIKLEHTPIKDWKLEVTSTSVRVQQ